MDNLENIFGALRDSAAQFAQQLQTVRNQFANAQAQTQDVAGERWTLNNLAAQWDAMTPESQRNLVLLVAAVGYFIWK